MISEKEERLAACEREIRQLRLALVGILVVSGSILLSNCSRSSGELTNGLLAVSEIRTSQLIIEDESGTVRVRVGAELPDAIIGGRVIHRENDVAGILLYDSTGQERGGYVTESPSGNVLLTLDGRERQTALFVADTTGATALRIWRGSDAIDLRSDSDGARVSVIRGDTVAFQEPPLQNPSATGMCQAYRQALTQLGTEQVRSACRQRMAGEACNLCLGAP